MEASVMENRGVMCQLRDPEGNPLGTPMHLPQDVGPIHLQQIVNKLLDNLLNAIIDGGFHHLASATSSLCLRGVNIRPTGEEKLPYALYIYDRELMVELGNFLLKNKVSVEKVVQIIYQPQAIFRIRPVSRCSATIAGHTEAVLSVAFSPDGRRLASGSGDTTVRMWDLNTQTPLHTCRGHNNWVLCIKWSPDGKHLVSGSKSGELQCWDPETGEPFGKPFVGHRKWITDISWEPVHLQAPSRRFVSASKDSDARVWDVNAKRCLMCLSGHVLSVTCVTWGGDGFIYTGSQDCTIKVWDTKEGKLIRELKGHGHWVNSLSLSTEYVLRTGAFDHKGAQYNSPEEIREAALARYNKARGNAPERLASGSDDFSIYIWEPLVSKQPKFRLTGHQQLVNHLRFSPDGQWLASASFDKSVRVWNVNTGKFVTVFRGHVGAVYQICWSPDGRFLVSASKDSTVKVWDIRAQKLKHDIPGHSDEVNAVDWSPDGEKVASGGKDRTLKLHM